MRRARPSSIRHCLLASPRAAANARAPVTPPLLERASLDALATALARLEAGFADLPAANAEPAGAPGLDAVLLATAERLRDNYPYFHPLYAGQMLKPPHPVARAAYALAMWVNPNNHALDGGRATSAMEKEAVAEIARMVGWSRHLGHLTGGGTMANLEALWVAGRLGPDEVVLASEQAHYTHRRISEVLRLPFEAVPADRRGRMDAAALAARVERGGVGTVVATLGATATGAVDPLPEILALGARHGFRVHADAAYGGYFGLAEGLGADARAAFDRIGEADSIVIDPHKHGLQPYGCGCVLFRDPEVGRFYRHDSPYTYFTAAELHLGEIQSGVLAPRRERGGALGDAAAPAARTGGAFAQGLDAGLAAARGLFDRLAADPRFVVAFPPELDIVVWAVRAPRASEASALARRTFDEAARLGLHLALAELPAGFFDLAAAGVAADQATVTCLRLVLMKPEHLAWLPRIWELLSEAADGALRSAC